MVSIACITSRKVSSTSTPWTEGPTTIMASPGARWAPKALLSIAPGILYPGKTTKSPRGAPDAGRVRKSSGLATSAPQVPIMLSRLSSATTAHRIRSSRGITTRLAR